VASAFKLAHVLKMLYYSMVWWVVEYLASYQVEFSYNIGKGWDLKGTMQILEFYDSY